MTDISDERLLRELEQAFMEMHHAYTNPEWFTKGKSGASAQFRLWLDKGTTALRELQRRRAGAGEPVAWMIWQSFGGDVKFTVEPKRAMELQSRADLTVTPLYAHPPADADRRDAERYRWLRDKRIGGLGIPFLAFVTRSGSYLDWREDGSATDAAIDAAKAPPK